MNKIRIKNFGPIRSGFINHDRSDFIDINKVTVLIGPQGSGKSTVAKLVSCFTWLEKAFVKDIFDEDKFTAHDLKKQLEFNQIDEYLEPDSELEWFGLNYRIFYEKKSLKITPQLEANKKSEIAKIMYVPAERNFLSSFGFRYLRLLPNLSLSLKTFLEEYQNAKSIIKKGIRLPITNAVCEYDRLNDMLWIKRGENKIRLEKAASGFQSLTPLFLVSEYLAYSINEKSQNELNFRDEQKLKQEIKQLIEARLNTGDKMLTTVLEQLTSKFFPSYFFNIVEEPEQNLFPDSQKDILFHLLKCVNKNQKNKLFITTHSPYILGYLNCSILGKKLLIQGISEEKINNIIPSLSLIDGKNVSSYQLDDKGNISIIEKYNDIPSDGNSLNKMLNEINAMVYKLLGLENV